MNQPALFELSSGHARHADPLTSVHAARRSPSIEALILEQFATAGPHGLTDDELVRRIEGRHPPTIKTARSRLSKAKPAKLVWSGENRLSDRGLPMMCWRLVH